MNVFDRICAAIAVVAVLLCMLFTLVGAFAHMRDSGPDFGCFVLVLLVLAAWGVLKSVMVAWNAPRTPAVMSRMDAIQSVTILLRESQYLAKQFPQSERIAWQLGIARRLHDMARQERPDPIAAAQLRADCDHAWARHDWSASVDVDAWLTALEKPPVCRACGYDLRASPDRCPECGTAARD